MPRRVDHEARRGELIETAWRVVARRGLGGATLRQIADEAGYANGALKPYFPSKTDLLDATYAHVFERTQSRITTALAGARGLGALRRLCLEVLPVNADLLDEARLVIAYWDLAARRETEALASAATLDAWRTHLRSAFDEARDDGGIRTDVDHGPIVELVLGWLFGAQVTAVVDPGNAHPKGLEAQLDALLTLLATPA